MTHYGNFLPCSTVKTSYIKNPGENTVRELKLVHLTFTNHLEMRMIHLSHNKSKHLWLQTTCLVPYKKAPIQLNPQPIYTINHNAFIPYTTSVVIPKHQTDPFVQQNGTITNWLDPPIRPYSAAITCQLLGTTTANNIKCKSSRKFPPA